MATPTWATRARAIGNAPEPLPHPDGLSAPPKTPEALRGSSHAGAGAAAPPQAKPMYAISMARPFDPTDPLQVSQYVQPLATTDQRNHTHPATHMDQRALVRAQERAGEIPWAETHTLERIKQPFQDHGPLAKNRNHMSFHSTADKRLLESRQFTAVSARRVVDVDTAVSNLPAIPAAQEQREEVNKAGRRQRHMAPTRGALSQDTWAPVPQGSR